MHSYQAYSSKVYKGPRPQSRYTSSIELIQDTVVNFSQATAMPLAPDLMLDRSSANASNSRFLSKEPPAAAPPFTPELVTNIFFGICAIAVGIVTIWQGRKAWDTWRGYCPRKELLAEGEYWSLVVAHQRLIKPEEHITATLTTRSNNTPASTFPDLNNQRADVAQTSIECEHMSPLSSDTHSPQLAGMPVPASAEVMPCAGVGRTTTLAH